MFLVVGLVTCVAGILTFCFLPDNPFKSRLTHEEKVWAVERLRENQTGIENKTFKPSQVKDCFSDPQTLLLCLMTIAGSLPNGAASSYQATIIKNFGYDSKTTALLSIPSGGVGIVAILCSTYLAGRYNQRGIQIISLYLSGIIGGCLLAFLPEGDKAGKLIGNYLTQTISAGLPLQYSWVAANYAGHTKKVTMNALLLMSFCLGNILGPLTFTAESAPTYLPAKASIVGVCAAAIVFVVLLQAYYTWENKRREKLVAVTGVERQVGMDFADQTDRENVMFRYQL